MIHLTIQTNDLSYGWQFGKHGYAFYPNSFRLFAMLWAEPISNDLFDIAFHAFRTNYFLGN